MPACDPPRGSRGGQTPGGQRPTGLTEPVSSRFKERSPRNKAKSDEERHWPLTSHLHWCTDMQKGIYPYNLGGELFLPLVIKVNGEPPRDSEFTVSLVMGLSQTGRLPDWAAPGSKSNQNQRTEPFTQRRACGLWPVASQKKSTEPVSVCWKDVKGK